MSEKKKLSAKRQIKLYRKEVRKAIQEPTIEKKIKISEEQAIVKEITVQKQKVTIVLEQPVLNVVRYKGQSQLVNFEDHSKYIEQKLRRTSEEFRPDILHQSLLTLLDSPLNKAGCLRILINTESNEVIEINSETKIPRTFKRFSGMMAKLLEQRIIKSEETILLQILDGSIKDNLPQNSYVIGTSYKSKLVDFKDLVLIQLNKQLVIVVGAVSVGHPCQEIDYINQCVSISRYQLSTANCLSKIIDIFEDLFGIL